MCLHFIKPAMSICRGLFESLHPPIHDALLAYRAMRLLLKKYSSSRFHGLSAFASAAFSYRIRGKTVYGLIEIKRRVALWLCSQTALWSSRTERRLENSTRYHTDSVPAGARMVRKYRRLCWGRKKACGAFECSGELGRMHATSGGVRTYRASPT